MATKLYVGNLSFSTTGEQLETFFAGIGKVDSAHVVQDHYSGRSRGFGFVVMASDEEAENAVARLNGAELHGRQLKVNEARPHNGNGAPRRYSNGYPSGKSGFGSDQPMSGYGTIYGSENSRRPRW